MPPLTPRQQSKKVSRRNDTLIHVICRAPLRQSSLGRRGKRLRLRLPPAPTPRAPGRTLHTLHRLPTPVFQDEVIPSQPIPIPIPTYLPPTLYPPLGSSPLPPDIFAEDDTVVIPSPTPGSLYQTPTLQARVLNMSCVMDSSFKSTFRVEGRNAGSPPPVIDNGAEGCISARSSGTFSITAEGSKRMSECGVRRCTVGSSSRAHMCAIVRMPTCTPQDSIVSHTKHIRLGPTTINKGRSAGNGVIASGGGQRNFDSRIVLLRKSGAGSNFDQPLLPGSAVQLGEELVLRAVVQDSDGWRFSRVGPVIVRSSSTQKSVTLIEENGCRSSGMRSICPFQPRQLSPLDTVLHFRAFLFQSSSKGDDMLLSVRMLGCMHAQDCYQNGGCTDANLLTPPRFRRSAKGAYVQKENASWESQVEFRVQVPQRNTTESPKTTLISKELLIMAS
ncbi:hypothetical protein NQ318_020195, partial [Aromia moschata]